MSDPVSSAEAGRIRDAARIVTAAGAIAIISFIGWFFWEPAFYGVVVWPLGLFVLTIACIPLLRPMGPAVVTFMTLLPIGGLLAGIVGVLTPPPESSFSLGNVYGAGFMAYGAWFVGLGAILRELAMFGPKVASQTARGGVGLATLGASWFIDDLGISLALLIVGVVLIGGIDRFIRAARTFGVMLGPTPAMLVPNAATDPSEWISPDSRSPSR